MISARSLWAAPQTFDIPSLPLVEAIERLSALTGVSIGGAGLAAAARTHAVRGATSAAAAVRAMLVGTGLTAVRVDARTYRLVRATVVTPAVAPPQQTLPVPDIVVAATKRALRLDMLGTDVEIATFASPLGVADQREAATDLTDRLPSLASTRLGRGRDKLFLRGIADSSFAARNEATLGEYLAEARLNYNAPDPGLLLYDIHQVELLKGPQGSLYGGGTLGGVLRIEPERPHLDAASGFVDAAGSSTQHGARGYAIAGMANLPVIRDRAGVRLLAYRRSEGGYIDDVGRGLRNVNRSTIDGGRAQARATLGDWTIDLLGTHQRIRTADSDYALADLRQLARASGVAQPARNRFDLLDAEMRGSIAQVDVVSTTSVARNDIGATYDATPLVGTPTGFHDTQRVRAVNNETRLSRSAANGSGWIAGISVLAQRDASRQRADGDRLADVAAHYTARRLSAGAFAQATLRYRALFATAGVRASYADIRLDTDLPLVARLDEARRPFRASPMVEVGWMRAGATVSLSYREGWRDGGATLTRVAASVGVPEGLYLVGYRPDHIRVAALGAVYRGAGAHPLSLQATLSGADWDNLQIASIDQTGLVYVGNARTTHLANLDMAASWTVRPSLTLAAGASLTKAFDSSFYNDELGSALGRGGIVPSVPDIAGYVGVAWNGAVGAGWTLGVEGRAPYLGQSALGIAPRFPFVPPSESGTPPVTRFSQGGAIGSRLAVRLARGGYSASLEVDNLAYDRSSQFAYGNPLTFRMARQVTPQRPRTVTLAVRRTF